MLISFNRLKSWTVAFCLITSGVFSEEEGSNEELSEIEWCDCGCAEEGGNCSEKTVCHTDWSCARILDRNQVCDCPCHYGEWLPEDPVLFRPFLADPRQVTYSVGWRFNDNALYKYEAPVSFGDTIAFYRWHNIWPYNGDLQVELEGAIWAVFDPTQESAPLINADYYAALPITYAFDRWQFRLRLFHISSHIGDEFLLMHPKFRRKNPSAEYLDFFISHDLTDEIRLYAGLGYIVHQDSSFRFHRFYQETGFEIRMPRFGFYDRCQKVYGEPIFAVDLRHRGDFKKHPDMTYIVGYEFGKLCGLRRCLRAFIEYHDGYSVEGQFQRRATNYLALRLTYGF